MTRENKEFDYCSCWKSHTARYGLARSHCLMILGRFMDLNQDVSVFLLLNEPRCWNDQNQGWTVQTEFLKIFLNCIKSLYALLMHSNLS